jgi:hypothetical protein
MSHKSGHIIIQKAVSEGSTDVVQHASVDLLFGPDTPVEVKLRKVRQVERLLDKLDHDDED